MPEDLTPEEYQKAIERPFDKIQDELEPHDMELVSVTWRSCEEENKRWNVVVRNTLTQKRGIGCGDRPGTATISAIKDIDNV